MSVFSERLTNLRESKNFTKTKMANKVSVGLSTYANWEYGYNEPDINMLKKLANILDTSVDYLTGRTDNPERAQGLSSYDLDKMLDNARSFDGKPIDDDDREIVRTLFLFNLREM